MRKSFLSLFVLIISLVLPELNAQETSPQFVQGADTLVVYKDVPGLAPSEFYSIRVRSAATNNQWVDVFAHITRNKAHLQTPAPGSWGATRNYALLTTGWSHTYCNVEMNKNSPVEFEIASKNGFKINNLDFFKATTHPSHKASVANVVDGKVYFTVSNPASITVDINGQMDDYKPISTSPGANVLDANRARVHTISIFANPVMAKPILTDPNIVFVESGIIPSSDLGTKTILYFKPGVHNIGMNFKLQPGKKYFIPGDAIVYGTFNNLGVLGGDNIKLYGYGTISGDKYNHPDYDDKTYTPTEEQKKLYKPVHIDGANNSGIQGVCIANSAYHSVHLPGNSYCKWVKVITWRGNGDGIGSCSLTEDCFIRTNDDCAYIKGDKRRCIFWKDAGGAVFHMAGIPENTPLVIEDCDVLYLRGLNNGANGKGLFVQRGRGTIGQRPVNVLFKDFRIHDKYPNETIFSLAATDGTDQGSSYKGITFQNITAVAAYEGFGAGKSEQISGNAESPWYGGIIFDKCTIAGKPLSIDNFKTNDFVKDIWFRMPEFFTITKNANPDRGTIMVDPIATNYIENSTPTLTALAKAGYEFISWSGDIIATTNPLALKMNGNKTVIANFSAVGAKILTVSPAINGTIVVNSAGASQTANSTVTLTAKPAIGYKFDSWSGDLAGSNIVTPLKMDADKTISANFVKTNSFAINCGGDQYIAADGTVYVQTPTGTTKTNTISGTTDQFLYQSEKAGNVTYSYDIPVDNGDYTVTLKFAEIWWTAAGKRVFNVAIEGTTVISDLDIFVAAGGAYKAYDRILKVNVSDAVLNIGFIPIISGAKISAIKVTNDKETSIAKTYSNNEIAIYPNPATNKLFVNANNHVVTKIQLVDITGKVVLADNALFQNSSLDMDGIASGLYIVKVYTSDTVFSSKVRIK